MRCGLFDDLTAALGNIECEDGAVESVVKFVTDLRDRRGRLFFIGNGGSAAIASHIAIDFLNKAYVAAMAFNESPALTCLSNDYGYHTVFSRQLHQHAQTGDMLVAISSSGASQNILNACNTPRAVRIVTLTGFSMENPLRKKGHTNFYVPSFDYGVVETAHLAILHALLARVSV